MLLDMLARQYPEIVRDHLQACPNLALVSLDEDLRISDCNEGFCTILDLADKPIGTSLEALLVAGTGSLPSPGRGPGQARLEFRTGSGPPRTLACRVLPAGRGYLLLGEPVPPPGHGGADNTVALNMELQRLNQRLRDRNAELNRILQLHRKAEKTLRVTHRFLEVANRHSDMDPMLHEFLPLVKELSGCEAVGMRVLDEDGRIPYRAYTGFPEAFHRLEGCLSLDVDRCFCVYVVLGDTDPGLPFYTDYGSFHVNAASRFRDTVPEASQIKVRGVCVEFGYESLALVPIRLGDSTLGLIHVADRREGALPPEVIEDLEKVALEIGTAIQRVRTETALHRAHRELERRVQERTADLARSNVQLRAEIRERERAQEELRILSSQLLTAQEDERKRISRDLHDTIGQSLSALKFTVENALHTIEERGPAAGLKALRSGIRLVQGAVEEVRRIQRNLRPPTLDDLGLLATISWYAREFEEIYEGIRIDRQIQIQEQDVPEHLKIVIYRILQEALNNVAKHSGASRVTLVLRRPGPGIEMTIRDNGVGFEPARIMERKGTDRGIGLFSMKERAELTGGRFSIRASKGEGTEIRVSWPALEESSGRTP